MPAGATPVATRRNPTRLIAIGLTLGAAVLLLVQSVRILVRLGLPYTNEDNALIWAAAVDYGRLHFRQPNSWGQFYIAIVEAGPTWLLMETGLSPGDALMIVLTVLMLVGWTALAVAAAIRSEWLLSGMALVVPLSFGLQYSAFVQQYGAQAGRTLAMVAVALVVARPRVSGPRLALFVFAAGICVGWFDPSTALLLAPAAAWLAMQRHCRQRWLWAVAGGVPAVAIWLWIRRFNALHPEYEVHPRPRATPSTEYLIENVRLLPNVLNLYRPASVVTTVLILLALGLLAYAVARTRSWQVIVPALVFGGVALAAFSTASVHDGFGEPFFPWGRTLMSAPAAIWFIAFLALTSRPARDSHCRWRAVGVVVTVAILLTATVANVAGFNRTTDELAAAGLAEQFVQRVTVETIDARCAGLKTSAGSAGVSTVAVFTSGDRILAYACPVLEPGLAVYYPPYERRVWLLNDTARSGPARFLITGVGSDPCAAYRLARCTPSADGQFWVVDSPLPLPQTLQAMGLPIVPFRAP